MTTQAERDELQRRIDAQNERIAKTRQEAAERVAEAKRRGEL